MISAQLSFSLPVKEYPDTSGIFPAGALVVLTCSNGLDIPYFYVSSRSPGGNSVNFTCYDRAINVDRDFIISDSEYTTSGTIEYAPISAVMSNIVSICGFAGYTDATGTIGSTITQAQKDWINGKKCRDILDDLSRACGCIVMVQGDVGTADARGTLVFIPVNEGMGAVFTASSGDYQSVCCSSTKSFGEIEMSSGSSTYTAGSGGSIVEISTPYASANAVGALYNRLHDYTYKSWECPKMQLTSAIPVPSSLITFPGAGELYVNYATVSLTSSGVYASLGRNVVSEDMTEYLDRTNREIRQRYRLGDVYRNVKISDNGITYVLEDKVNNKTEEYGFEITEGGITKFDGAMIDGVMPESVEKVSDTEQIISYGNKKYKLTYDVVSGKKTNIKFVEVV